MRLCLLIMCLFFAVLSAYPLLWMVYTGMKSTVEFTKLDNTWGLPKKLYLQNYSRAWNQGRFKRYYLNSIVVNAVSLTLIVFLSALAGYAFARMEFRSKETLFYIFLAGMMVPIHITLIPLYRMVNWGLLRDSYFALIFPYTAFSIPLSIFILRGFFEELPVEIEESARLDGCSEFGVFLRVALPLSRPALATVTVVNFVNIWNEFVFANTLINSPQMKTIPPGLMTFSQSVGGVEVTLVCAALTISVLPVMVCYFLLQRQIISGLTAGALKQ